MTMVAIGGGRSGGQIVMTTMMMMTGLFRSVPMRWIKPRLKSDSCLSHFHEVNGGVTHIRKWRWKS